MLFVVLLVAILILGWCSLQTWPSITHGSDSGATVLQSLDTRTQSLQSCFSGSSAPGSPVEGQLWADTSGTPRVLKIYLNLHGAGLGWYHVGVLDRFSTSPNADPDTADGRAAPYEFKALRIENRAGLPAVAAGNKGLLAFLTGDGEVYVADQGIANAWKGLLSVVQPSASAGSYDSVEVDVTGSNDNDGTNPPTAQAKGVLHGWLFDATVEKKTLHAVVPKNWAGNSDLVVRLYVLLNQVETAGDDIEWSGSVRLLTPATAKAGKTATLTAASATDIGSNANGIADGGLHACDLVIDFDDGTNPVTAGDLLALEINRTEVTNVAGVVLVYARLLYRQKPRHERA